MHLTGTGVWSHHLRYGDEGAIVEIAAELDELGYTALWIPDVGGDVLTSIELLLRGAPRSVVATGILNVWMHEPSEVASRRVSWDEAWQRRFLLGLGVSHQVLIDHGNPGRYEKPYSKMVEYLDGLDAADVPVPESDRVLAALKPRMLALARDRVAGIHPYFVPPEHVARARELIGADAMIAVELAVVLDTTPSSARETARKHTATYTGLPNYTNNLLDFGFTEADFADRGSDRLVDAIVAWGDVDAIATRVKAMRDAGANHVCIQVITPGDEAPLEELRQLAPALL